MKVFHRVAERVKMTGPRILKSPWGEVPDLFYGNAASFIRQSPLLNANLNKKILIDAKTQESLTASQLFEYTDKLHYVLKTVYGIRDGDVVCLFSPNSIYTPVIHYGTLSLGAVLSPSNIQYTVEDLHHQLSVCKAKLIIVGNSLVDIATKATKGTTTTRVVRFSEIVDQIKNAKGSLKPIDLPGKTAKDKDAYYCFSSGTSGTPKGVMSTHHNMTSNTQQQFFCFTRDLLGTQNTYGAALPMSHIFGLSKFVYSTIYVASTVVVFEKFDFELLLQSIIRHRITTLHVVPPMLVLFAKSPLVKKYPIKNILKNLFSGAAPAGKDLIHATQKVTGAMVSQGYGLTESSPVTHLHTYDVSKYNQDSVGWLAASCEARIVDEDGNDCPLGKPGELWIRGPNIMKGYLNNPTATAETLTPDGFLRTGDVAIIDKTGQYYIVDRIKELIKSKGHQVAPAELEAILLTNPDVNDVAVVGVHIADQGTELPRAFVVLKDGVDPLNIKKWFDTKVARHKRLWGGVVVLDVIPKSASGKILRRVLRQRQHDVAVGYRESKL
jgi:4-coumarate--CoA ligase